MKLYKLTDSENKTYNNTQWGDGITRALPPTKDPKLCTDTAIHTYRYTAVNTVMQGKIDACLKGEYEK